MPWIAASAVQLVVARKEHSLRERSRFFSSPAGGGKPKGEGGDKHKGKAPAASKIDKVDKKAAAEASMQANPAHVENQAGNPNFRTTSGIMADADPRNHRASDAGKVYPLPKKTIESVFPEGLCGLMHKMLFGLTRRRHGPEKNSSPWYDSILKDHPGVLIRKEAVYIISELSKTGTLKGSPKMPTPGFLLDGPPGSGKSMIINHCVHWARSTGDWLVVFLPEPSRLVLGYGLFQRGEGDDAKKIYQPEYAETILKQIQTANKDKLSKIAYTGSEGANCAEAIEGFLAQTVSAKEKTAMSVLVNVMDALKNQTAFPLLVAVDEMNALRGVSCYLDLEMKPVPASNVVIAEIFGRFLEADYARGVVLGAATRTGLFQNVPLPPFNRKPVQVPGISRDELKNFLTFQQNIGLLYELTALAVRDYRIEYGRAIRDYRHLSAAGRADLARPQFVKDMS